MLCGLKHCWAFHFNLPWYKLMIILKIFIRLSKKIFIVSIIYEWYFERFFILVWWKITVNPLRNIFFCPFFAFFFRLGKNQKTTVNPLRNNFFVFFFCFFFRFGKNQKITVNPLRNNFGKFWRIFFAIGIKKNFQLQNYFKSKMSCCNHFA